MKVLLINTLYAPHRVGGAERSVQFLAEGLAERGLEVHVASLTPGKASERRVLNGVVAESLPLRNLYWPFHEGASERLKPLWHVADTFNSWMADEVSALIARERPDLVHTNNLGGFSVAVWPRVKAAGLPLVHTLRDYYLLCPRTTMFRRDRECATRCADCRLLSAPRIAATKNVDAVVGISRFILNRHLEHRAFRGINRHHVIYNPYDPGASKAEGPRGPGPLRIGFLGRIVPTKGIDLLLATLGRLPSAAWELKVAGVAAPEYERHLRTTYPFENVQYQGHVPATEFLGGIDVLVVPSLWNEPLGRVVLEAYAQGVPVITSNRGGLPEVVEPGVTGLVFDPGDPDGLLRALSPWLEAPELLERYRAACLRKATEYAPARITDEYLRLYEGLAS